MIADALVYAGASLYGTGRTLDQLLAAAREAGVDHVVAAPAKPRDYDLAGASERLADECGASAGRAVCLARLDPWQDDAADRLAALLEHPAVRGLLLHPWEETFPANSDRRRGARRRRRGARLSGARRGRAPARGRGALAVRPRARASTERS